MTQEIQVHKQSALSELSAATLEKLIASGDLSKLTPEQRVEYYRVRCVNAGLEPSAQPFEYLTLQGKTILYARKACTDQLASIHKIRLSILSQETTSGIRLVTVQARAADGRETEEVGAVPIENLKGEALANAMMKALTKAKRRAILSLCGLGMLDETEVASMAVPDAKTGEVQRTPPKAPAPPPAVRTVEVRAERQPEPTSRPAPSQEPQERPAPDDGIDPGAEIEQVDAEWFTYQGIPISKKVLDGRWSHYKAVKDDSKMKDLVGFTWDQLTDGSPGGKRERSLRYIVARARDEANPSPIEWTQKAAVTLHRMFKRHAENAASIAAGEPWANVGSGDDSAPF